jgi:cytochrome oxidase assembly protein ShyY1
MTKLSKPKANWLSWTLLVLSFTAACWFLSQWQFDRQAEVVAKNNLIEENYDTASKSLNSLLSPQDDWNTNLEFRSVLVEGQYLPEQSYLVRNRPLNAYPGFLQLVAFRSEQGSILWVERGWLPTGSESDTPDDVPVIDSLSRTIEVRLRPTEPDLDRTAPEGQLSSIYLGEISETFDQSVVYAQAYGRLISESPKLESGQQIAKPILSEGNHLSYAMQWILFGLMAIGAVVWTLSQERRRQAGLSPRRLRFLNTDKDGEIEDKILN